MRRIGIVGRFEGERGGETGEGESVFRIFCLVEDMKICNRS